MIHHEDRYQELAANLAVVRSRISAACAASGRDASEVTLIAVTKTYPATDVAHLASLGVTDVAENRDQEAASKVSAYSGDPVTWHFVGQVQTNKARSIAGYADVVQTVDRASVVLALEKGAQRAQRMLDVCIQVSLDAEPEAAIHRGGAKAEDVGALAEQIEAASALRLAGLMAVAPLGEDPRIAFERLKGIVEGFRAAHPQATLVSAGMSNDLEVAIASGATHVRIGTALLGRRFSVG